MKKTPNKKLSLNKTSLRVLSESALGVAKGMTGDYCLLTPSCKFVCTKVY
jgi:hypothetical protein